MTGCCVDKSCTPETCMRLPEGKTCGDCYNYSNCRKLFGCKITYTTCDWFPRRYREEKKCFYCGRPGGKGPRELRPYGPDGADVCAECVIYGKDPKRLKIAEEQFSKRINKAGSKTGVAMLTPEGPVPFVPGRKKGKKS